MLQLLGLIVAGYFGFVLTVAILANTINSNFFSKLGEIYGIISYIVKGGK